MEKHKLSAHQIKYFRERLKFLRENCWDEECKELKIEGMILAGSYIDSLAGYKYGGESNRDRFVKLVKEYSGKCAVFNKISLPSLYCKIKHKKCKIHEKEKILRILESIGVPKETGVGVPKGKGVSPDYNQETDVAADDLVKKFKELDLKENDHRKLIELVAGCDYAVILWKKYRCLVVHETRIEEGWNLEESELPYYMSEIQINPDKSTETKINFGIPHQLIIDTLSSCLDNLETELGG
jgi:hypothetical protein